MNILERATIKFRQAAKPGQPFTPSDADRMIAAAVDYEIEGCRANEAMLHRHIKGLEKRLDALDDRRNAEAADGER